ncbi:MAG: SDR family oxidoreductase [Rickettsiales bacterium]|jgi:3-oxoacyl-[acyl-carrier protein] reductase|nr:SDR family oxidoreductase [Rickettsiales bacterium]
MKNKKVLITGGSEGLGKAMARKLHDMGASVIIAARDEQKLAAAAKEIGCDYVKCDITDLSSCQNAARIAGDIDILVNNAGIWTDDDVEVDNPERARVALETNLLGAIFMTNQFLSKMREKNSGTIFFTNSVSGRFPIMDPSARTYSASKWGLRGYAEALKEELKTTKIKVIQIHPCGFDTNIFESSGWDKSSAHNQSWMTGTENIANAAVFALTQPDDINVSSIVVDKSPMWQPI